AQHRALEDGLLGLAAGGVDDEVGECLATQLRAAIDERARLLTDAKVERPARPRPAACRGHDRVSFPPVWDGTAYRQRRYGQAQPPRAAMRCFSASIIQASAGARRSVAASASAIASAAR